MVPGLGALGGGVSTSASANTSVGQTGGGINVGGLNTGTQGLDLTTIAVIGAVVIVALLVWRK
jgi:hypothetical protein